MKSYHLSLFCLCCNFFCLLGLYLRFEMLIPGLILRNEALELLAKFFVFNYLHTHSSVSDDDV